LQEAFGNNAAFADIKNSNSVLVTVLKSSYFKDQDNENGINIHSLLLMGVLHSNGDNRSRARVLYDILQDANQEFISANDKDFRGTFDALVGLATKLVYEHLTLVLPSETPAVAVGDFSKVDSAFETLSESFLDDVFGSNSKLQRPEYEKVVSNAGKWLFSSKELRSRVEKEL
jgi:hypothetical protein